jgi:2-dehydro-3-deoxyphosphogluconate aldolase/(4S)-4-hydroxy-2-oxoglutarate aldolase
MSSKLRPEDVLALTPVLPVVTIDDAGHAEPLARALIAGGIKTVEITLRTEAALGAIKAMAKAVPEMVVGAGTVLRGDDLKAAVDAGASYALAPGGTKKLMKIARKREFPFIPGVVSSSEIMLGFDLGYTRFKFFPAEQLGGVAALKALAGPLAAARFCPTGGISAAKAASYLALDNVACVGGSWIATREAIAKGDWDGIEAAARTASALRA